MIAGVAAAQGEAAYQVGKHGESSFRGGRLWNWPRNGTLSVAAHIHHLLDPAGCIAGNRICTSVVQELLLEQLLQRAYQNMIAENRASIEYEDIGGFSGLHCLLPVALLFAVPDVAASNSQSGCCAASAVNKWPATDFLKGSLLRRMVD